jgi:hypothetical protein
MIFIPPKFPKQKCLPIKTKRGYLISSLFFFSGFYGSILVEKPNDKIDYVIFQFLRGASIGCFFGAGI